MMLACQGICAHITCYSYLSLTLLKCSAAYATWPYPWQPPSQIHKPRRPARLASPLVPLPHNTDDMPHTHAHNRAPSEGGIDYPTEFKGCFKENATARALPWALGNSSAAMTPTLCRNMAMEKGYRFYATQNGTDCFGGNVDPTFLGRKKAGCELPCPG